MPHVHIITTGPTGHVVELPESEVVDLVDWLDSTGAPLIREVAGVVLVRAHVVAVDRRAG